MYRDERGFRRATRPADRRLVGGVASGLADHLNLPVVWIRVGFVVSTWFNGVGILAYLLLWRFMSIATPASSPGLESATRAGLRSKSTAGGREITQTLSIAAVGLGGLLIIAGSDQGLTMRVVFPLLIGVVGLALVWRQFDDATSNTWLSRRTTPAFLMRTALGIALVVFAMVYLVTARQGWSAMLDLGGAFIVALLGVALILGPWVVGLWSNLEAERRERIRSQERADMAAHLHDSVLQTLALLQKNAQDPATVSSLARRQERELRSWLYEENHPSDQTAVSALTQVLGEVEDQYQVAVEFVSVGDAEADTDVLALVNAVREATVNSAKHADVARIDVFAEVTEREIEVFVRDRGRGFDVDAVAEDRRGIRDSIIGRMARHGGTASVRSTPDSGTEVKLVLERAASAQPHESPL